MIVIIHSLTSAFLFLIEPALWFTLSSQKINAYLLRVNYAITVRKYKNYACCARYLLNNFIMIFNVVRVATRANIGIALIT